MSIASRINNNDSGGLDSNLNEASSGQGAVGQILTLGTDGDAMG